MTDPNNDPPVAEIRELRRQISAACDHDPAKLIEYYIRLQERHKDRLLRDDRPDSRPDQDAA